MPLPPPPCRNPMMSFNVRGQAIRFLRIPLRLRHWPTPSDVLTSWWMPSAQIISTLQGELNSALRQNLSLPDGTRMQAGRVVVCFQFATSKLSSGEIELLWNTPESKGNASPTQSLHTLTLEFNPIPQIAGTSEQSQDAPKPAYIPLSRDGLPTVPYSKSPYRSFLGPPSFDSAARATVFREAFEYLSLEVSGWLSTRFRRRTWRQ